jgi:hypothetical protein
VSLPGCPSTELPLFLPIYPPCIHKSTSSSRRPSAIANYLADWRTAY